MEHRLHRKKVLASVARLKYAESERERQYMLKQISKDQLVAPLAAAEMGGVTPSIVPNIQLAQSQSGPSMVTPAAAAAASISFAPVGTTDISTNSSGPKLDLAELMSWVRHSKNGKLKVGILAEPNHYRQSLHGIGIDER